MAFTDLDNNVYGIPTFNHVPVTMLDDFGRIAVISGAIEAMAYDLARSLGLRRPGNGRTRPFAQECADIVSRLSDPWLPQHIHQLGDGMWRDELLNWARKAPGVIDEHRNAVLHRAYYSRWSKEEGHQPIWNPDARDWSTLEILTEDRLADAIRALVALAAESWKLVQVTPPRDTQGSV